MRVLRLAHFFGRHGLKAIRVQQSVVGVFVVDGDHPMRGRAFQGKESQPVMVHAHLYGLLLRAVARVKPEGRHLPGDADRFAPGGDHLGHVTGWHLQAVGTVSRDRCKAQSRALALRTHRLGTARQPSGEPADAQHLQALTTARIDHLVQGRICAGVAVFDRLEGSVQGLLLSDVRRAV